MVISEFDYHFLLLGVSQIVLCCLATWVLHMFSIMYKAKNLNNELFLKYIDD